MTSVINRVNPIYILSLPRSGSTLVQRIVSQDPSVATHAEPWIALPLIYVLKQSDVCSDYDSRNASIAIDEFISSIENGRQAYLFQVSQLLVSLYKEKMSADEAYFLDKTPRYSLIADELHEMFPDGKFVYLWRNPLAVIASSINTWGIKGRWNVYNLKVDLYTGLIQLIKSYKQNKQKAYSCRYEDLVQSKQHWIELFNYLSLDFNESYIVNISKVKVEGYMGDKTGIKKYQSVTKEGLEDWKAVINNPLRKFWCKRYLNWLGKNNLAQMGYELDSLLYELKGVSNDYRYIFSDILLMMYGLLMNNLGLICGWRSLKKLFNKQVVVSQR